MSDNSEIVAALAEEHICRITDLTKGQLRAWDKRGFFVPKYVYDDRSQVYSRIYSFKDAVGLKALSVLRKKYKISLNKLVKVADQLKKKGYQHWADVKLHVLKKQVYFQKPGSNEIEGLEDGQYAMLEIIDVIADVNEKVQQLKQRSDSQIGIVEQNKFVARNSAVISGTRIPTATIRRYVDAGYSIDFILSEYPTLTKQDIEAALKFESENKKVA